MNLSESDRSYVKHKRSRLLRHASDTGEARRSEPGGRRSGQVLILMSLVVSSMLVMGGLLLDGGRLYFVKSRMQAATDAAAFGAAHELFRENSNLASQLRPAALNDSGLNGFNDSNSTVTVSYPPADGPRSGNTRFVQVEIEQQVPTTLLRLVGQRYSTVRARSVAGLDIFPDVCILAMDPVAPAALLVRGTADINADCGLMSNSTASNGFQTEGSANVTGSWAGVSGAYVDNGTSGSMSPAPDQDVPPLLDPLAYLDPPDYSTWPAAFYDSGTKTYICPGGQCVFSSHLTIAGPPGVKTFQSGTYVLEDGMTIQSSNVVNGTNVTFYVAGGQVTTAGSAQINLTAPAGGYYKGILFFFNRNAPPQLHELGVGGATFTFRGAIYGPSQNLRIEGSFSGATPWGVIVGNTVDFAGEANLTMNRPPANEAPDMFKVTLVE